MTGIARYDGHAEWYDETFSGVGHPEEEAFLRECLGDGGGEVCLDVACGTGRFGPILADLPYREGRLAPAPGITRVSLVSAVRGNDHPALRCMR